MVCSTCIASTHSGHIVHQVEDGIKYLQSTMDAKKAKIDEKMQAYTRTILMYENSYKEIEGSFKACKESIIDGFKQLKDSLDKRQQELCEQIENAEMRKLNKSTKEVTLVQNAKNAGNELVTSYRSVLQDQNDRMGVLKKLLAMESNLEKEANSEEIEEFPFTDLPIEKYLNVCDVVESLKKIGLVSVIDPRKSSVSADTNYSVIGTDIKLSIYLKGRYDIINPLLGHNVKWELSEKPTASQATLTSISNDNRITLSLKGDYDGTYMVRVTTNDKDIKGSPFECIYYTPVDDVIEVPEKLNSAGTYHPLHKEFWIRGKEKIQGFNLKGIPVRLLDGHFVQFTVDDQGNVYGGDGDKNFMKYDKVYREKWSVFPAEGKNPICACCDESWVYALYKNGPLLVLSKENGNTISVEEITNLDNAVNMIVVDDNLLVIDGNVLKLFTKKGKYLKTFDEFRGVGALGIINRMVYICKEKSNQWVRVLSPKHMEMPESDQRKLVKLPSLYLTPRGVELGTEGVNSARKEGSFLFSKLPLSPRNNSMKK